MSWSSDTDIVSSVSLCPDDGVPILPRPCRAAETAYLTIGRSACEIRLARAHVEALRDQHPDVLAAMDRVAAEDAACEAAEAAGRRAVDAAATALDQALAADAVGAGDLAEAARVAAARATAAANGVDAKVDAMEEATAEADDATERARYAADGAADAIRRFVPGRTVNPNCRWYGSGCERG